MNINRKFRNTLFATTMFFTTMILGGKAFGQEQKPAHKGEIKVEVTQNGDCIETVTKQVVTKKKTPQQLYSERWAKWQRDNNATKAELRAAQQEENDNWIRIQKDKRKQGVQKQVDKSAVKEEIVLSVDKDCPDDVVCTPPIVGKGIVLETPKDTLKLFCETCDDKIVPKDSLVQDFKEKRPWTVRTGYGNARPTGHNAMDSYQSLGEKKAADFFFAEIETPTFAEKGVGSWFSAVGGVEIFEKKEVSGLIKFGENDAEASYYEYNTPNANAGKDNIYAGLKIGKVINEGHRFTLNPHIFGHVQYFMTKEKHNILFDGEGVAPQVDKKIPLDLRVGAGMEFAVNLSKKETVRNGNGLSLIGGAYWQNSNILQESRQGLIRDGAEEDNGARINGRSQNGFFQNGEIVFKAGLSYKFGGKKKPVVEEKVADTLTPQQEWEKIQREENAAKETQKLEENKQDVVAPVQDQEEIKRPTILYDADGNVYEVDETVKIKKVEKAPAPAPAPQQ